MANTSLRIGGNNWAVKEDNLLGYNVIQNKYVPIEMNTVRATTATRVNENGLIEVVPYNLASYSEQFDNAIWQKSNAVVTANDIVAPNGTLTADKWVLNGPFSAWRLNFTYQAGVTYTLSFWGKKEGLGVALNVRDNTNNVIYGTYNLTNDWVRYSFTFTPTTTSTLLYWGIKGAESTNDIIYLWGAQLVTGTEPKEYFPTTDRLNIPRIDYSSGTASLLVEPQRTNLFTNSEGINNASTLGRINCTYSLGSGFNGFNSSNKVNFATFNNSYVRAVYIYNAVSGDTNYFTFHFKKKIGFFTNINFGNATNLFNIKINLETGALISTSGTAVGTTQVSQLDDNTIQVSFKTTTSDTTAAGLINIDFYNNSTFSNWSNSDANDFALISGIQRENNVTYATSYIPTVASSVTRNADVISKTGISSLIGQTEGTVVLDFELQPNNINGNYLFSLSDGTASNLIRSEIYILSPTVSQFRTGLTTSGVTQGDNFTTITQLRNKMAISYSLNNFKLFINGVLVYTDTTATIPATSGFYLGNRIGLGNIIGANYKQAILFKTQLTDQECINLTTI